jgi:anti-anti-sigma factor
MSASDVALVEDGDYPIVRATGELDRVGLERLENAFRDAAALDRGVVLLSLLEATYLDSLTVHAIMAFRSRLLANRQRLMLIVPPSGTVRRILEIVGIPSRVPTYESVAAALAAAPSLSVRERS